MDPENWIVFSVIFGDQASLRGHWYSQNVDKWGDGVGTPSGVLGHHLLHSLLIFYFYILLTVCHQSRGRASKALSTCTAHSGHVILWPCIFISLFPLSTIWVGKFLAVVYVIITPLLNPAIYTLRNKEMGNAIKWLWWQTVDFCWYFIISNYQNVFREHPKLSTPILLLKTGKSSPIHI